MAQTMRVKILPPHGSDRSALDERGWAELPAGSTVRDALRLVRCAPLKARLLLVSVNVEQYVVRGLVVAGGGGEYHPPQVLDGLVGDGRHALGGQIGRAHV